MQKTETGYNIRTYDNGVLHFVIGRTYTAFGTCGTAKDMMVTGELTYHKLFKKLELIGLSGQRYEINERTLSYL